MQKLTNEQILSQSINTLSVKFIPYVGKFWSGKIGKFGE